MEYGAADEWPVILSHGFPYDVYAFADVANTLHPGPSLMQF